MKSLQAWRSFSGTPVLAVIPTDRAAPSSVFFETATVRAVSCAFEWPATHERPATYEWPAIHARSHSPRSERGRSSCRNINSRGRKSAAPVAAARRQPDKKTQQAQGCLLGLSQFQRSRPRNTRQLVSVLLRSVTTTVFPPIADRQVSIARNIRQNIPILRGKK